MAEQVVVVLDKQPGDPQTPRSIPQTPRSTAPRLPVVPPRPALTRLPYSKPKSRFVEELNHPLPTKPIPDQQQPPPHLSSTSDDEEEEDEDDVADEDDREKYMQISKKRRRVRWRTVLEWSAFILLTALLASALTVPSLTRHFPLGLALWKWSIMALVILCGRLVSGWLVWALVFLIERRFLLREKVLYFVFGLRKSFQNCVWLGLVLLSWTLLFDSTVESSGPRHRGRSLLLYVSRALVAILIGAAVWLIKILLVKVLAYSFHVATFFERMKVSVFHHYVLETLSGPPLDDDDRDDSWREVPTPKMAKRSKTMPARLGSRRIDMDRLRRLSRAGASACNVKRLVGHVMKKGLSTLSMTVDRTMEEEFRRAAAGRSEEITSKLEARMAAVRVFRNVVSDARHEQKYIEEEDLLRFLTKEVVQMIFPLFEGALETGKIKKSAFRNWVVRAYMERKYLALSLNDTKTAVHQLHKLASAVVSVIIIVVSLLVMGVATSKVLVVVTSQLLLVGFMFQNTGKTIFESIIFVFVMHPFDVGDRCVIDGVQMIVEEMNILTTVFLRYDNEKIYYPNAVLLTKPISNFYRSPEMGDTIEFSIDVSTSLDTLSALKNGIQSYIESKPKHWHPKHSIVVREIENVNKMKMALYVLHTMNHQNFPEKINRRSELVLELKKIFESLSIKYHLLPQEVHLTQVVMANERLPMHT